MRRGDIAWNRAHIRKQMPSDCTAVYSHQTNLHVNADPLCQQRAYTSCEADRRLDGQETPRLLWTLKIHYKEQLINNTFTVLVSLSSVKYNMQRNILSNGCVCRVANYTIEQLVCHFILPTAVSEDDTLSPSYFRPYVPVHSQL